MASALATLTANYTDSEVESEGEDEGGSKIYQDSLAERQKDGLYLLIQSYCLRLGKMGADISPSETPNSSTSGKSLGTPSASTNIARSSGSASGTPNKKAKLVSYHDPDAGPSDEETEPGIQT